MPTDEQIEAALADGEQYVALLLEDVARERARAEAAEAALAELRAAAINLVGGLVPALPYCQADRHTDEPGQYPLALWMRLDPERPTGGPRFYCDACDAALPVSPTRQPLRYAAQLRALAALLPPEPDHG